MNEKLLIELNSHYANYIEQKKLCEKTRQCTFLITGKSEILQEQFICLDCFPSEKFGICKICVKACHQDHNVKFFRRSRFYCQCAILGHNFISQKGKQIAIVCKCMLYNIDKNLQQKLQRCPRCNIYLCYFCMTDGFHKTHFDQQEQNEVHRFFQLEQILEDDYSSYTTFNTKNMIFEKKQEKNQKHLEQISSLNQGQSVIVCQCDDQKHHKINKMRSFMLNYKEYVISKTLNNFYTYPLFNMLFEQEAIYDKLFKDFCIKMKQMNQFYIDHKEAKLSHQNSFLEFVQMYEHLKLINIFYQTKNRFLTLSNKFTEIMGLEYIDALLINYPKIQSSIDELSINYVDQIHQYLLDYFYLKIKNDVRFMRKIETKSIENLSCLQRIMICEFSNYYRSTEHLTLDYDYVSKRILHYLSIIFQYDRPEMQQKMLRFCLKSLKILLKCRLFKIGEEQVMITNLMKVLKNELQKHSLLWGQKIIEEKNLALLSDILILSLFNLKDLKFIEALYLNKIDIKQCVQYQAIKKAKTEFKQKKSPKTQNSSKAYQNSKANDATCFNFIFESKDNTYVALNYDGNF